MWYLATRYKFGLVVQRYLKRMLQFGMLYQGKKALSKWKSIRVPSPSSCTYDDSHLVCFFQCAGFVQSFQEEMCFVYTRNASFFGVIFLCRHDLSPTLEYNDCSGRQLTIQCTIQGEIFQLRGKYAPQSSCDRASL